MSARWIIGLSCNGCRNTYGGVEVPGRDNYGAVLAEVRRSAAGHGWTHSRGPGRGRPVRDWCPACSIRRRT